ncbi:MAG: GLUG motif-containing protein [Clostridia bacterium]
MYIQKNGVQEEKQYIGFFSNVNGDIQNLNIEDCDIEVTGELQYIFVGAICGGNSTNKIDNCSATGKIKGNGTWMLIGGIAGVGEKISNSIANVNIEGRIRYVGGIAGQTNKEDSYIRNCGSQGQIIVEQATYIGGITRSNTESCNRILLSQRKYRGNRWKKYWWNYRPK